MILWSIMCTQRHVKKHPLLLTKSKHQEINRGNWWKKIYVSTVGEAAHQINSVWTLRLNSVPDSSTAQFINFFVQFSKQFQLETGVWSKFGLFNKKKCRTKLKENPCMSNLILANQLPQRRRFGSLENQKNLAYAMLALPTSRLTRFLAN